MDHGTIAKERYRSTTGNTLPTASSKNVEVQRGMHSPGFEALRLGAHERCSLHMHAMIDGYWGSVSPSQQLGAVVAR
jgi:hypothetical protein